MPELPPELQARLDALRAETEAILARMPPLDVEAELRRIDAKLAEQYKLMQSFDPAAFRADLDRQADELRRQAEKDARWDRKMMAVFVVGGVAGGAVLFAAGMFAASRMPAGRHDDDVLVLAVMSLFFVALAVLLSRR